MAILKIFRTDEWQHFRATGVFSGSADDLRDGFIHFSTEATLSGTLAKYFKDESQIIIADVDNPSWGDDLKWEISRGGASFPHLYTALYIDDVKAHWELAKAAGQAWDLSEIEKACEITFAQSDVKS